MNERRDKLQNNFNFTLNELSYVEKRRLVLDGLSALLFKNFGMLRPLIFF